nr:family 78 glycoside hydrolase catalytic domain [uncultured Microbacterium sp.]
MNDSIRLRAEYRSDSPWVARPDPRLSWIAHFESSDWQQTAAEVRLDDGRSAIIETDENVLLTWPFEPLRPRDSVSATVRLRDAVGSWSEASEALLIRYGGLDPQEWVARYVGLASPRVVAQPFVVRHRVTIDRPVAAATLYWSALGAATPTIDGVEVDDAVLSPGWTSYPGRVVHETVDVTRYLALGARMLGFSVTGAWFTESYGFGDEATRVYGEQPTVAAQLHLRFEDGTEETISSSGSWEAHEADGVVSSGLYDGETIDARRATRWWDPSAQRWPSAVVGEEQPIPVPRTAEPVRRVQELKVKEVLKTPSGRTVLDFGQNLVGRLRVRVSGVAGTEIVVRHAEVLEHGELGVRPLRRARATDRFVLAGVGRETFEPTGTFHGFRYAEVEGWPGDLDPDDVRAIVLHSDMRRTGRFTTSNALVQQLHENVVWGMRGNFFALPTDCPQRDERLGWTGDAQIFAPTATTLFDCQAFFDTWLTDLRLEQERSGGVVATVVPNVFGSAWPAAGWGDAATVIPSVIAERYADPDLLRRSLESMRAWVEVELQAAGGPGLWESTMQFGDWLDPSAPAEMAGAAKTSPGIVATAYLARSLDLFARAAEADGQIGAAEEARSRAAQVRTAFSAAYVTPAGRMLSDAATAYAIALRFDIVTDASIRRRLAHRLAHVVKRDAFHISTGFLGTPLVLDALTDYGYDDEANALLMQTRAPSWLYPVTMGATTVWERWDSMLPDGSINSGEMTSFNHYALGAVVDWLYRRVAGLAPASAGYRRVEFAPVALAGLDDAYAEIDTPSGRVAGGWRRLGDSVEWTLEVPSHARAVVRVPGIPSSEVGHGVHVWTTEVDPTSEADPVTIWSPVSDVVVDTRAYDAVMTVLESHDTSLADLVRRRTDWTLRAPLAVALFSVPADVTAQISAALEALRAS